MKKLLTVAALFAVLSLASCNQETNTTEAPATTEATTTEAPTAE